MISFTVAGSSNRQNHFQEMAPSLVIRMVKWGADRRCWNVLAVLACFVVFSSLGDASLALAQEAAPAAAEKSLLSWLYEALGWFYIVVFLTLSFVFVSSLIMNILALRQDAICPQPLVEGFEAHLDQKQYQEAYELAKADDSFLGNVLSSGLSRLSTSYPHAVNAMQEVGAEENLKLEHRLSYLALLGSISPMIGLFGTVDGMIRAFYTIGTSGTTPQANQLAGSISTALLTTLLALGVAIPALISFNILRNRLQRLVLEVGTTSDNLMGRFEKVGKKKE